ncbi:MAG: hypothetical protein ACOCQR_02935 [bacterium]
MKYWLGIYEKPDTANSTIIDFVANFKLEENTVSVVLLYTDKKLLVFNKSFPIDNAKYLNKIRARIVFDDFISNNLPTASLNLLDFTEEILQKKIFSLGFFEKQVQDISSIIKEYFRIY